MTYVSIRYDEGRYRCGRTPDGIRWTPEGCEHETPREASRHADRVQRRLEWEAVDLVSSRAVSDDGDRS